MKTLRYVNKSPLTYGLNTTEERRMKVIVSMTTFSLRLNSVHKCLKSLLLQDTKPDMILVYLGNDVTREMLPAEMLHLEQYGVEYRFVEYENLRSYKKFYYAMKEYPNDIIITVDDDVYYPRYWLTYLLKTHNQFPECVCAWRLHQVKFEDGELLPYSRWKIQYRKCLKPSFSLFPTGVGGVLYPPNSLNHSVFDKETFKSLCFTCDDIWLKVMCLLQGTKTVWVPNNEVSFSSVESQQEYALSQANIGDSLNDEVLSNVLSKYNLGQFSFDDEK